MISSGNPSAKVSPRGWHFHPYFRLTTLSYLSSSNTRTQLDWQSCTFLISTRRLCLNLIHGPNEGHSHVDSPQLTVESSAWYRTDEGNPRVPQRRWVSYKCVYIYIYVQQIYHACPYPYMCIYIYIHIQCVGTLLKAKHALPNFSGRSGRVHGNTTRGATHQRLSEATNDQRMKTGWCLVIASTVNSDIRW